MPSEPPASSQEFLAELLRRGPLRAAEFDQLPRDIRWAIEVEWIRAWLAGRSAEEVASELSREEVLDSARQRALDRSAMLGFGKSLLQRDRHAPPPEGDPCSGTG
ncbi:MAG: hypothetical protein FGM37_01540 [Phycisphaerales bacterium]|nr:hypothetical protein [Phycisphaerales bacterium]